MKKAIADILKVAIILIIAAGLFYVVYPKYHVEWREVSPLGGVDVEGIDVDVDVDVEVLRYNKITGEVHVWGANTIHTQGYWICLPQGAKPRLEVSELAARQRAIMKLAKKRAEHLEKLLHSKEPYLPLLPPDIDSLGPIGQER